MNERQTVVFVIEALTVGGAEQMLVAMANQYVVLGWRVHMVCLTSAGELSSRLNAKVELHVLEKKSGADFSLPLKLRRLLCSLNPTAVNCHLWTANLWTRLSLIGTGLKVIATEHSRDSWKPRHYLWIDHILARFTHTLVAVSEDTADFYRTVVGIPKQQIKVINNGIDAEKYSRGDGTKFREQWAPNGELLIGTVGRMVPAKNHKRLVDTALELSKQLTDFKVLIVGEGPEKERTAAYIDEKNAHEFVFLVGPRADIPDVLSAFDVFVLSSDREGHPLTALEAQAAGTPVVLTDAGGSSDAIAVSGDAVGGIVVEKDTLAFSAAVAALAQDDNRRQQMGEFAQQHAKKHFTKEIMVKKYTDIFLSK